MNTKREILQNKVISLLNKKNENTIDVLRKIENENNLLTDKVAMLGKNSLIDFSSNGVIKMHLTESGQVKEYVLHENAIGQLADKFGIPRQYVKKLYVTDWGRNLLKEILVEHRDNIKRSRVLIRSINNEVRGVLSDRYRRLNSNEIYREFIKESKNSDSIIYEAQHTDTKSYLSTIIPEVVEVPTENNGSVYSIFGARISNSDFGNGALDVRAFQMNCVCLNGMVSETMLKQIHLGKRLPENINFSEETYKLDTMAMSSAVKDIVKQALSIDRIKESMENIQIASSKEIDIKKELIALPKIGMRKEEVSLVEQKLLESNEETGVVGKPTKWKLSQAINSVGNDVEGARKQELQELAGKFIKF